MSRLILIVVLIAALVAAASLIAAAWNGRAASANVPAPRRAGAIQKVAYVLLIVVMTGVATGWMGAE